MAVGSLYDLLSEAPTYATVTGTEGGTPDQIKEWNEIITSEFDKLQKEDDDFDYNMQVSQNETMKHGIGPLFFDNELDWRPVAVREEYVLVPDKTKSNLSKWTCCAINQPVSVADAFDYIADESSARKRGWNVELVQKSIIAASPSQPRDKMNWEAIQNQIRNNDILASSSFHSLMWAHLFVREKNGKISHYIVDSKNTEDFIYKKSNKYDRWQEVLIPMYYDVGNGEHHGVKGIGTKMYNILDLKNRTRCHLIDVGIARGSVKIQAATKKGGEESSIIQRGPWAVLPPDNTLINENISGAMEAPAMIENNLENLIQANLSTYRQRLDKPNGNPRTAREIDALIAQSSTLGKTQIARYYHQLDALNQEKFRRATSPLMASAVTDGARAATKFMETLRRRGIPESFIRSCKCVATRVAGQGSQLLRSQNLQDILALAGALPEDGRANLVRDYVASKVGQSLVDRYAPIWQMNPGSEDQVAYARMEHAAIKEGIQPLVTGNQDHSLHLHEHFQTAAQGISSLETNPQAAHDVAAFVAGILPHAQDHLNRMSVDPVRKGDFAALLEQYKQLAKQAGDLMQIAQQAPPQGSMPQLTHEQMMEQQQMMADNARKDMIAKADIARKEAKAQSSIAIADAKAAAAIARK
jgi:hypothetical protein